MKFLYLLQHNQEVDTKDCHLDFLRFQPGPGKSVPIAAFCAAITKIVGVACTTHHPQPGENSGPATLPTNKRKVSWTSGSSDEGNPVVIASVSALTSTACSVEKLRMPVVQETEQLQHDLLSGKHHTGLKQTPSATQIQHIQLHPHQDLPNVVSDADIYAYFNEDIGLST